jgi:hypothetical protein
LARDGALLCVTALSYPTPSEWPAAEIHPDLLSTPDKVVCVKFSNLTMVLGDARW